MASSHHPGFLRLMALVAVGLTGVSTIGAIVPAPSRDLCPANQPRPTTYFCDTPAEAAKGEIPVDLGSLPEPASWFLSQGQNLTIGPNDLAAISRQEACGLALRYVRTSYSGLKSNAHPRAIRAILAVVNAPYAFFAQSRPGDLHPLTWIADVYARDGFYIPAGNIGGDAATYSNTIVYISASTGAVRG